jgi:hypothetical protein
MDDLEGAMNQLWRQGGISQKEHTTDDGGKMVMAAFGWTGYNCQEEGYMSNQCPKKAGPSNGNYNTGGNTKGRFSGTCIHCDKIGHK